MRIIKYWQLTIAWLLLPVLAMAQSTNDIFITASGTNDVSVSANSGLQFDAQFDVGKISWNVVKTPAGSFVDIATPGFAKNYSHIGDPHLPVIHKLIEIPQGATPTVQIISSTEVEIDLNDEGVMEKILPTQPSLSKSTDPQDVVFQYNEATYLQDDFVGDPVAFVNVKGTMRGITIGGITVCPFRYNPVTNKLKVLTNIQVRVIFNNADVALSDQMKKDHFSPMFESTFNQLINYRQIQDKDAITVYPITYIIVAPRSFEATLQPYINWKTKKGFKVIEGYTDVVGTSTTAIKSWLQNLYNTESPKPTYVLFVGDVAQIPAYTGTTGSHPTDLYYCTYSGGSDFIPELYFGRFSAESTTELQTIIGKTLMHEEYTWPNDDFLDKCVMVAGVDASFAPTHGNGQIYYGIDQYFNTTNGYGNIYAYLYGTSTHPYQVMSSNSSGASNDIISKISNGVGYANYTAHCSEDGWADPNFARSDISGLANANEYPVMIGNCCLSNKFNTSDAFGEMIVYAQNKGAVAYMGASNNSLWDEDFYWSVGINSLSISTANAQLHTYSNTQRGAYDGVWHTHGEAEADWFVTTRSMLHCGNIAVENSTSGENVYYWEIYHLMGDPSLMPYLSKPIDLTVDYIDPVAVGTSTLVVNTEPYAYVAISLNGELLDAKYSGSNSSVTLTFPAFAGPDTADIVVTKQNRKPYIGTLEIINNNYVYDAGVDEIIQPNGIYHISQAQMQPRIVIRNSASTNLTSVKVRYKIDSGNIVNFDWTGNLATNGTDTVDFPQITLTAGNHSILAFTYLPNGNADEHTVNDSVTAQFTVYNGDAELTEVIEPFSQYCSATQVTPIVVIKNADSYPLTSLSVKYRIDLQAPVSKSWTGNLAAGQSDTVFFASISPAIGSHTFTAYTANPNAGTDADVSNDTLIRAFNMASGLALPFTEDFEATQFPPNGWLVENPDGNTTWARTASAGNGTSLASAYLDAFDYAARGATDDLITPVLDLFSGGSVEMTFNVAYRQVNSSYSEGLKVFASSDCGATFNPVPLYNKSGAALATTTANTNEFTPSLATQWRMETVDLTQFSGNGVVVKFVSTNDYGNNLYIDDINIYYITESPITDFSVSETNSCSGLISFSDLSENGPTSWLYDFGDGTTSTEQDPAHQYTTNGTYTVSLIATNAFGQDTATYTDLITIDMPDAPVATGDHICGTGAVTLVATGSGVLNWYDAPTGGSPIHSGDTLSTTVSETTTFYVDNQSVNPIVNGGSSNISSNGGTNTGSSYLIFSALENIQIISVDVNNTGSAGNKVFSLRNSSGTVLQANTFYISTGISTVDLQYDVPVGSDYQLGAEANCNLYRNNAGVSYPYSITGLASITGSSGGAGYYYYFYNWKVKKTPDCNSLRVPVLAEVDAPDTVAVSISAPTTEICPGDSLVFTAVYENEGTTPVFQWKINGGVVGTNSSVFGTTALTDNDLVTCELTSDIACAAASTVASAPLSISVNGSQTTVVTITASAGDSICEGSDVIFTAHPAGGGITPQYQWLLNGSPVGADSPSYIASGLTGTDEVSCVLTSSSSCASGSPDTSDVMTFEIQTPLPVSVAISASASAICDGETVSFDAVVQNGGPSTQYQWLVNGSPVAGSSSIFASSALNQNDIVSCNATSSLSCVSGNPATSNEITIIVTDLITPTITVSVPSIYFCAGDLITFSSDVTNEGSAPEYLWLVNDISTGVTTDTYSTSGIADGDIVTCQLTSDICCASQSEVSSNLLVMHDKGAATAGFTYSNLDADFDFTSTSVNAITWAWDFGDGSTSSFENPSHLYTASGIYTVSLTVEGPCDTAVTSQQVDVVVTGIQTANLGTDVRIMPNPAKDNILVLGQNLPGSSATISLCDMLGRTVYEVSEDLSGSSFRKRISLAGIEQGLYFVIVKAETTTFVVKCVIE
ncbi:MAG: PKD domain-containing protein [Bacteroidetes bacterium]|nr:PKD domain-containing protein [Bacteroidota bacterium]MBU1717776.1 PKD domain-containing protein [Bacteroidota bacterium]